MKFILLAIAAVVAQDCAIDGEDDNTYACCNPTAFAEKEEGACAEGEIEVDPNAEDEEEDDEEDGGEDEDDEEDEEEEEDDDEEGGDGLGTTCTSAEDCGDDQICASITFEADVDHDDYDETAAAGFEALAVSACTT